MSKVSLIVHQNYLEEAIKNLHENGLMEITNISKDEPETLEEYEKSDMHPDASICANYEIRLTRLIDILKRIKPTNKGIKNLLKPQIPERKTVEEKSLDEICSYTEGILEDIEKSIINKQEKLKNLEEKEEKVNADIQKIKYLKDFDIEISDLGRSHYTTSKAGVTEDIESLQKSLNKLEKTTFYSKPFITGKKTEWTVIIVSHISEKEQMEKICRNKINELELKEFQDTPQQILKSLEKEKTQIKQEKKEIISKLRKHSKEKLHDLLALREEIQLKKVRKEIPKNFAKTKTTYLVKGWTPEKNREKLKKQINEATEDRIICNFKKPSKNPDKPPIHLETPNWAQPFKNLLKLFALPKYNEIDPTAIMGVFFVLFFGFMLGDAGYGITILGFSILGYKKFSQHSKTIKDWSTMGIWLGLATTIIGILTNSFFGDFIPRFIYGNPDLPIYTAKIGTLTLPVESLGNPITILTMALILGIIQLNVGVVLGIYQSYKRNNYKKILTERFCWIPLQLGGGMLIGKFILDWILPTILFYIAAILVIIGIIQLFLSSGPIGFFDITGYVGDWLSYARLLALGLATAGMALAFNVVAGLIPDLIPLVGIILMPIILVIAHTANLGLQALGAGVHSLRLQYVEFFNRFYEGGGKPFTPFKIKRKYTKIKEKN